jgi:hypothetical protein
MRAAPMFYGGRHPAQPRQLPRAVFVFSLAFDVLSVVVFAVVLPDLRTAGGKPAFDDQSDKYQPCSAEERNRHNYRQRTD